MVIMKNIERHGNMISCDFFPCFSSAFGSLTFDLDSEKIITSFIPEEIANCAEAARQVIARLIQIQNQTVFQDVEMIVELD